MSGDQHDHLSAHNHLAKLLAQLQQLPAWNDRKRFVPAIAKLSQQAHQQGLSAAIFHELTMSPYAGGRVALEFLIRLPLPLPLVLTAAAVPVLKQPELPQGLRLAAAAVLCESVPDDHQTVSPIVEAIQLGVPGSKQIERLGTLQRMVLKCNALDQILAQLETHVKLQCPICEKRIRRAYWYRHLWLKHAQLATPDGVMPPQQQLDHLLTEAATKRTPELFERAFTTSAVFYPDRANQLVFQALTARGEAEPGELDALLQLASEQKASVCPVCLSSVPLPCPGLPPAANLRPGRFSADAYEVQVIDRPFRRTILYRRPGEPEASYTATPRLPPRLIASVCASLVLLAAMIVAVVISKAVVPLWFLAGASLLVSAVAYVVALASVSSLPPSQNVALEVAWEVLTRGIGRGERVKQFLMRLALKSLTDGDPLQRASRVYECSQKADATVTRSSSDQQLAACLRMLLTLDRIRIGKASLTQLAKEFSVVFTGERDLVYADTCATLLYEHVKLRTADRNLLAVLMIQEAFAKQWSADDLNKVAQFVPNFQKLILVSEADLLYLYARIYSETDAKDWDRYGGAMPIAEYSMQEEAEAKLLFAEHRDLLLKLNLPSDLERNLGPIVLTTRGPAIGPVVASDTKVNMTCEPWQQGQYLLRLGNDELICRRKVPPAFFSWLRNWIRYTHRLKRLVDQQPVGTTGRVAEQLLRRYAVACPVCRYTSLAVVGELGTPTQGVFDDSFSDK